MSRIVKIEDTSHPFASTIFDHPRIFISRHHDFSLDLSKYEITRSAASQPVDIALPTDNPPLWFPSIRNATGIIKIFAVIYQT